jgi:hypothetical protein
MKNAIHGGTSRKCNQNPLEATIITLPEEAEEMDKVETSIS